MGFNQDPERPASVSDYLMTRTMPDYIEVNISPEEYAELTSDEQKNLSALISIIEEYEESFREEDLVEAELGPYLETDSSIPPHLLVWFDRQNLVKLVDGATSLVCDEFTDDHIHSAAALIAAYYAYAKSGWETDLGMVIDMEIEIAVLTQKIEQLQIEKSEPETLEEIASLQNKVKAFQGSSDAAGKKAEEKKSKIKLALCAHAYITGLFFD